MTANRQFGWEMTGSLAAYAVLLVVSILALQHGMPPGFWRVAVAVMPMLPAVGICWAVIGNLRRIDEMQRRVQLESLALAFMGTAFITFTYGFLENAGFPRLSMFAVWPLMGTLWVIARVACARRYA
jgi:hypothetical protein